MTKEDKELLIRDLSGRLPYDLRVNLEVYDGCHGVICHEKAVPFIPSDFCSYLSNGYVKEIKPYLLPISSITSSELEFISDGRITIDSCGNFDFTECRYAYPEEIADCIDYFNRNNYDYRGLIDRKLAIDATGLSIY